MSGLDRVFIKAYGKEAISQVAAPATERAAPAAETLARASESPRGDRDWREAVPPTPSKPVYVPLANWSSPATVPAPHFRLDRPAARPQPEEAPAGLAAHSAPLPADGEQPVRAAFEVPQFHWPPIVERIRAAAAAGFSALAGLVAQRAVEGRKVLALGAARRGEGASTLAMAIARTIGARHVRVALVDADFHRPQLADRFDLAAQTGWDEVLAGGQPLAEALIESIADRVTLLPLRRAPRGSRADWWNRLTESIVALGRACDLVVIDLGPLAEDTAGGVAAAEVVASLSGMPVDAILVRDARRTSWDELARVGAQLTAAGIGHWDAVENFVEI